MADREYIFFGPFQVSCTERTLMRDNSEVVLGGRAFDILLTLLEREGHVVSQAELMSAVWPNVTVDVSNLRTQLAALRKILGDGKDGIRYIVNVAGQGYSFVAPIRHSIGDTQSSQECRQLPSPGALILGRDDAIARLTCEVIARRFVTVIGAGGVGKTTVAIAVAHALASHSDFDGKTCCFVDLSSMINSGLVASAVASALGCVYVGVDPIPHIEKFLREKRALLIIDNCEHLIEATALLCERLFSKLPCLHILTTSREPLRVQGERVYNLAPLQNALIDRPTAAQALASPAVQLFMARAEAGGYYGGLDDLEAPIVVQICRRLDGIALAIELVASRVGNYGIHGTAQLLENEGQWDLPGRRSAPQRHETLFKMLEWSFRLLSDVEQAIFCRLSTFAGPFTLEAAQCVAGDTDYDPRTVTSAVSSLVEKSLVAVSPDVKAPYRLLFTTRTYATFVMQRRGEGQEVARQHAIYFAKFLERSEIEGDPFEGRTVSAFDPHVDNLRKALDWSFSSCGDAALGIELASLSAPLLLKRNDIHECQHWCRKALEAMSESARNTLCELKLQEALALSSNHTWGKRDEVKVALERALDLTELLGDGRHQLYLLAVYNVLLARNGDFPSALQVAKRASKLADSDGGLAEKVMAEWMLAASCHLSGDQLAALQHAKCGFELEPRADMRFLNTFAFDLRAKIAQSRALWLLGLPDQAAEVAVGTIEAAEQYNHPVSYSMTLVHCVPVLIWLGRYHLAEEYVEVAITIAQAHSLPILGVALALKGELLVERGDAAEGLDVLLRAQKSQESVEFLMTNTNALRALGDALLRCGRSEEALELLESALSNADQRQELLWLPELFRTRGEIILSQREPDIKKAEASFLRSIEKAHAQSALSWELRAAIPLARMWKVNGREKDALAMLEKLYERFTEGFSSKDLITTRQILDTWRA